MPSPTFFQQLSSLYPLQPYISLYSTVLLAYFGAIFLGLYAFFVAEPSSFVARCILTKLPDLFTKCLVSICGPRAASRASSCYDYVANQRNPIMQIAYLLVVLSAWSAMVLKGYPIIRAGVPLLRPYHCELGYLAYASCLGLFYLACAVPSGSVTAATHAGHDVYPYDHVLFAPRDCPATGLRKIPRSKHSRLENRTAPRFDHFCVWLNQSVGAENYRIFLAFLLAHALMLTYGAYASFAVLHGLCVRDDLFNITFYNVRSREYVPASAYVVVSYLSRGDGMYAIGLLVLSGIMGLVMWGFLGFHVYLTSRGVTTNEHFKWGDLRRWHRKASAAYERAKKEGNAGPPFDISTADYEMTGVTQEMIEKAAAEGIARAAGKGPGNEGLADVAGGEKDVG
ncbi:hypothetical protein TeGR_g2750, partial [Tetraparma gracilis]